MPVAEIEHLVASSAELMTRLAELAAAEASPEIPEARQGIAEHYRMLTQTVPLSPEAYRSLGKMYTEDPLQRSIVEAFHPDLPGWMTRAIESFNGGSRASTSLGVERLGTAGAPGHEPTAIISGSMAKPTRVLLR